jgi:predicted N-formylglutamate amidohydrolase
MADDATRASGIGAEEYDSYSILPGRSDLGLIVLCDHAGNDLPEAYGTLGLPAEQLQRHIAYDIGAAPIARALAAALEAPAVLTRYSRLLIDPNRGADDPTLIMRISDGAVIPGNRRIDAAERARRMRHYYEPYHRAVAGVIDRCIGDGPPPALLSIHSFTESWKELSRPWHVGVLWGEDDRLARPLLEGFYAEGDLIVGENEPYKGLLIGDCLWQHGARRGLANAIVEIRQDLIRDPAGQAAWTRRLVRIVERLMQDSGAVRGIASPRAANGADRRTARPAPAVPARNRNGADGDEPMTKLDKALTTELEAAAFRRLIEHFRKRTDVQNIDMMNLAGFCRNCLSDWYREAAAEKGVELSREEAREIVYGMPYKEWQARHQKEASPEALAAFEKSKPH